MIQPAHLDEAAALATFLREQLDGALAGQLTMAVNDIPGNDFIQPWRREHAIA